MTRRLIVALLVTGGLALTGCQPQPAFVPTPTRTPGGPADGAAAAPAETPTPAVTAPPPTATLLAAAPVGPDDYPPGINPLTGLPVGDPAVLARAPLAIKVSNDPLARPQSGLSAADLVFEHYTEGSITRLTAIYYGQSVDLVGSVRSGRLIDVEIVPMFDAVFSASGFSDGVRRRMQEAPWAARNLSGPLVGPPALIRIQREGLAHEHTMFAVPDELWALAAQRGVNNPPDLTPGLAFSGALPAGGTPAAQIVIDYSSSLFRVTWSYDPLTGLYTRSVGGEPFIDFLTGEPITASNVVVVSAMHVDTDILEDGYNGLWSTEIQVWGEGLVSLFRDGQRIEGRWTRLDPEQMLQFSDREGRVLYLRPGSTWFQLVPVGFDRLMVTP